MSKGSSPPAPGLSTPGHPGGARGHPRRRPEASGAGGPLTAGREEEGTARGGPAQRCALRAGSWVARGLAFGREGACLAVPSLQLPPGARAPCSPGTLCLGPAPPDPDPDPPHVPSPPEPAARAGLTRGGCGKPRRRDGGVGGLRTRLELSLREPRCLRAGSGAGCSSVGGIAATLYPLK